MLLSSLDKVENCNQILLCDEEEYRAVRERVALINYNSYTKLKISGGDALDLLNYCNLADIEQLPVNQMMSSFMLSEEGAVICDATVANFGDYFYLFGEGVACDKLSQHMKACADQQNYEVSIEDHTQLEGLIGVDGPYAWELLKEFVGMAVIGMRYLEIAPDTEIDGISLNLCRAGKSGEFSYWLHCDMEQFKRLWQTLMDKGERFDIREVSQETIDVCKMENRFTNVRREAQWNNANVLSFNTRVMRSLEKEDYLGRSMVDEVIASGLEQRTIGLVLEADPRDHGVAIGDSVTAAGETIGQVVNLAYSYTLNQWMALAFINTEYAYVGLDFEIGDVGATTVSCPFIMNKSLTVRPQEESYFD